MANNREGPFQVHPELPQNSQQSQCHEAVRPTQMWSASCCNQHNSSWRLLLYFIQVEWKRLAEKKLVLYYKTIDLSIIYVQMQRILYTIYATWFCFWGCSLELSRLHVLMETQNHLSCLGDQALRFLFCQECAAPAAPSSSSIVSWAVCQTTLSPFQNQDSFMPMKEWAHRKVNGLSFSLGHGLLQ